MASTRSAAQSAGCLVTRSHSSSHSWCLLLPSSDLNVSSFTSSASFFAASPHLPCAAMPLLAAFYHKAAGGSCSLSLSLRIEAGACVDISLHNGVHALVFR